MAKKKASIIPEVDILKSGVNRKDPIDDLRNEDGYIVIGKSKVHEKARKELIVSEILEHEKELKKLKEDIPELNKDDIKKISKKVKKKKAKNKKDNKSKKKKKKKESFKDSMLNALPDDLSEYIRDGGKKGAKKKKKAKKKKDKEREKLGVKVKEKRKTPNKKEKVEESDVSKRFKEVERITRENIKEVDSTLGIVDKRIKELTSSSDRVRGKDTALANYLNAKTSLISIKQKAATDILSSRAKVYDIELRKEKNASNASASDADIISKIFPGIAMGKGMDNAIADQISKSGKNKDSKKKKSKKNKNDFEPDELLFKREKELKKKGKIEYSPWEENIEWEGKFNVAIKKSWETQDWKFIAVDDEGNPIRDFPKAMLPSKKAVQISFDDEKDVAVDKNTNTMYQVFAVPRI